MATREPRGLGKGLGALLGEVPNADQLRKPVGYINKEIAGARVNQTSSDILRIPVDMIEPNPYQPRETFNQEAIEELAASIRTLGLIQPITVRKVSETSYQIISGERRYRACRLAGMSNIPAYIRETNDKGMLEMAIVENVQRENLDPIEVALSYQRLIDECQMTQDEMASRLGKKRTSVTNYLRLLKLPLKAQHDLKVGQLSVGHAKVILGVEDPGIQERLCDLVISEDLSVRELERKVKAILNGAAKTAPVKRKMQLPQEFTRLTEHLSKYFSAAPLVKRSNNGKGSITIKFSSDKEIAEFLKAFEENGR